MSIGQVPKLVPFENILDGFESERKAIIKLNGFSEDEQYVRDLGEAEIVLNFIKNVQVA